MTIQSIKPVLNRLPLTSEIPIEKIYSNRTIGHDKIFLKKYLQFIKGEKQALLTRISIKNIKNGFYERSSFGFTSVTDSVPEHHITYVMDLIRSGHRPHIYVYKNINKDAPEIYIAPDDSAVYQAYEALNIKVIPVVALETSINLEESAYEIRHLKFKEENLGAFLESTVAKKETGSADSILSQNISNRHEEELEKLHTYATQLAEKVKKFHSNYIPGLHYHQTIFSILYRLSENLQAIKLLIKNDYYFQAVCLLRSTYEISLDFYVDWLAPEQVGFWLQVHARVDRAGFNKAMELAHPLDSTKKSKLLIEKKGYCYNFLSNVSNKASLSPLGRSFYDDVYTFSSEVVHQDFNMTEIYSVLMENPNSKTFNEKATTTLIRCLDLITAKICHRVSQDIGIPH